MPTQNLFFDAVRSGNRKLILELLAQDRSLLDKKDDHMSSPIQVACYYGHREIAELLMARGGHIEIYDACAVGDLDALRSWLHGRPEAIHERSPDGFLPLCLAAAFGHQLLVEDLIEAGANVNDRSSAPGHVAPLDSAVFGRNARVVLDLLKAGANPNQPQDGGFYPLHLAAQNGDLEIVQALLQYGANPNVRTQNGFSPSDLARSKQHVHVVPYLEYAA